MTTNEIHQKIADYIKAHPDVSYRGIATTLNVSYPLIQKIAARFGIKRLVGRPLNARLDLLGIEDKQ